MLSYIHLQACVYYMLLSWSDIIKMGPSALFSYHQSVTHRNFCGNWTQPIGFFVPRLFALANFKWQSAVQAVLGIWDSWYWQATWVGHQNDHAIETRYLCAFLIVCSAQCITHGEPRWSIKSIMTLMALEISSTQTLAHFIFAKSVISARQSTFYVTTIPLIWQLGS